MVSRAKRACGEKNDEQGGIRRKEGEEERRRRGGEGATQLQGYNEVKLTDSSMMVSLAEGALGRMS